MSVDGGFRDGLAKGHVSQEREPRDDSRAAIISHGEYSDVTEHMFMGCDSSRVAKPSPFSFGGATALIVPSDTRSLFPPNHEKRDMVSELYCPR